ncbi:hypothetical protein HY988_07585 [Candidatus Micrarchaeota archaeon]|nr:hypothetical protein [Candidatus Micrarchaeota archaeon]
MQYQAQKATSPISTLQFNARVLNARDFGLLGTTDGMIAAIRKFLAINEPERARIIKMAVTSKVIEDEHPFSYRSLSFKLGAMEKLHALLRQNGLPLLPNPRTMNSGEESTECTFEGNTYIFSEPFGSTGNYCATFSAAYGIEEDQGLQVHAVFNGDKNEQVVASEKAAAMVEFACKLGLTYDVKHLMLILDGMDFELKRMKLWAEAAIISRFGKKVILVAAGNLPVLLVRGRDLGMLTQMTHPLGQVNGDKDHFGKMIEVQEKDAIVLASRGFVRMGDEEAVADKIARRVSKGSSMMGFGGGWLLTRGQLIERKLDEGSGDATTIISFF